MKKIKLHKIILTLLMLCFLLIGCNDTKNTTTEDSKFTIVTSFYPIYISTLNIVDGIDDVKLVNLTQSQTGCLHDYNLVPQDLKTLEKADVLIINGAGMESFIDKIITDSNVNIIDSSKDIPLLSSHEHDSTDSAHNHEEEYNPHLWVSISNVITQVQNIANELSVIDSKNSSKYQANATAYIEKLQLLKDEMHEKISPLPNKDIITFHEAFPYFAEEFSLNIVDTIEMEPGVEPSPSQLEEVIKVIKEKNIKSLFAEPQYSSKSTNTIAKETGAKIYILDPIVTGDSVPSAKDDYLNKMKENLKVLEEALQ